MTGLIKRGQAIAAVAALPPARPSSDPAAAPDLPAPDPRLAALEAEIERLETALVDQKKEAAGAIDAALRDARAEAVAKDERRTELVERGLVEARDAWDARLEDLELLAVKLARAALAKIFGEAPDLGEQVARTIAHHLGELGADAVIGVRVSARDFSSDAIETLGTRLDLARSRLTADPDLRSGACHIDLRLGAIDVEPARQWAVIDRALGAMERAG